MVSTVVFKLFFTGIFLSVCKTFQGRRQHNLPEGSVPMFNYTEIIKNFKKQKTSHAIFMDGIHIHIHILVPE